MSTTGRHELIITKEEGASLYAWFLARAGSVVERGAEPGMALCLAAAAFGLDPRAAVAIEFCGTPVGSYAASRLQTESSAVADQITERIGPV